MRAFLISAALLIPSAALAQPYQQPQPPPPQPYPQQPQPYPQPPQPVYQQPAYGQQPMYPQQPVNHRSGITFEANLGFGYLQVSDGYQSDTSDVGIAGLSLGLGGWANPKLAITGRLSGVTLSDSDGFGNTARLSGIFLGPSVQYWVDDHLWFGGGAGLAILALSGDFTGNQDSITGFGLNGRAGYTFNTGGPSTINASLELTPGFFSENGESATITGIGFLLGYQYL